MKNLPHKLFLLLVFSVAVPHHLVAQLDCETKTDAVLFNDSIKLSLRVIQKPLVVTDSSCGTFLVNFNTSKKKFRDVYDVRFYHESTSETTLKVSFYINSSWTPETEIKTSGKGYRTSSISILSSGSNTDSLQVKKMRITVSSRSYVMLDELEFRYFETAAEEPIKGPTKERKKAITEKFKEKGKKEARARKKELNRKNKELYGTDGQGGN